VRREPADFIVDPWVRERVTLVARQNNRVAAAAHLLRYGDDERVGPAYRNSGEIRWLLFWPEAPDGENPWWADGTRAATELRRYRRRRVATWLTGQAADWLALARVDRLLGYASLDGTDGTVGDEADHRGFLASLPFAELTRTRRGWVKPSP
jgi:hypothetical protein